MKICKKKSGNSQSLFVVIPQDQLRLSGLKEGDNVCVLYDGKKQEIIIKKLEN